MSNSSDGDTLTVWVYNYGGVKVVVDVYVDDGNSGSIMSTEITAGDYAEIDVSFAGDPLQKGDEVSIKVYSRRQNGAYRVYYI